jgi:hypothetical protein
MARASGRATDASPAVQAMLDRPSSKPGPSEPDGSVEGSRVLVATLCVRLLRSTLQVTRSNMDPVRDNFCVHAPQHRTIGVTVDAHTYHGAPFARRRMGNPHAQRRHRFLPSRVELHSTRSALSACRQGDQPRDNSCLDPCHHPDRPPESTYLPTPTLAARFHKQATRACSVQASTSPTAPRARRPVTALAALTSVWRQAMPFHARGQLYLVASCTYRPSNGANAGAHRVAGGIEI